MSDILNGIAGFIGENPEWHSHPRQKGKMSLALAMFATVCENENELTEDEDAFIRDIFQTMKETA